MEMVFEDIIKVLKQGRRTVYTLQPLRDIDTIEDLRIGEFCKKGG
jgi:glycosyltransferase A (GT-A) superfamily protein (DUF2064 family)